MTEATRHINSSSNPFYKTWLALSSSARERRKTGKSLLDGVHLVSEALLRDVAIDTLLVAESALANNEVAAILAHAALVPTRILSDNLFASLTESSVNMGIAAVFNEPADAVLDFAADWVVLDGIQDAGNLGTLLRTAAASGVRQALIGPGCAQVWSPKVLRAGMGGHFALQIIRCENLITALRSYSGNIYATVLDESAANIYELSLQQPAAWIFGAEGQGVSAALLSELDQAVFLPMAANIESLNVSAAAAACLFEQFRQKYYR